MKNWYLFHIALLMTAVSCFSNNKAVTTHSSDNSINAVAYVIDSHAQKIYQYKIEDDGQLNQLSPNSVNMIDQFEDGLFVNQGYIYAFGLGNNQLVSYKIGSDGLLTELYSTVISDKPKLNMINNTINIGLNHMVVVGNHAYVINIDGDTISQYSIGADGKLNSLGTNLPIGEGAVKVVTNNKYIYVISKLNKTGIIDQFAIESDGHLKALGSLNIGFAIDIEIHNNYVYVSTSVPAGVEQYSIGADGKLISLDPAFKSLNAAEDIVIVGNYAYVANQIDSNIAQFHIETDGTLTPLIPATVKTDYAPINIIVYKDKYIYTNNHESVSALSIGLGGKLSYIGTANNELVSDIEIYDKYCYMLVHSSSNPNDIEIQQYAIGANGVLDLVHTTPLPVGAKSPYSIVFAKP